MYCVWVITSEDKSIRTYRMHETLEITNRAWITPWVINKKIKNHLNASEKLYKVGLELSPTQIRDYGDFFTLKEAKKEAFRLYREQGGTGHEKCL